VNAQGTDLIPSALVKTFLHQKFGAISGEKRWPIGGGDFVWGK